MRCDRCDKRAVEYIKYSGAHLCADHFMEFFERRVLRELKGINRDSLLAIALSGGKDSSTLLYLAKKMLRNRIIAITIDEGIAGYRDASIGVAAKNCDELNIEHVIVDMRREIGFSMDGIYGIYEREGMKHRECSYCGVMRKYYLNRTARTLGADRILFAHNLDDVAQSMLMNFVRDDIRPMPPHVSDSPLLVPRVLPFLKIPEREVAIYAILNGVDMHMATCPYAFSAERNRYREVVNILENGSPGSRHGMLRSYGKLNADKKGQLRLCSCGEPSSNSMCMRCSMLEELKKLNRD